MGKRGCCAKVDQQPSTSKRSSLRLYLKSRQADVANDNQRSELRISRTVEMVDQSSDSWREPKSKLLFMSALGLTPKPGFQGIPAIKIPVPLLPYSTFQKDLQNWEKETETQNGTSRPVPGMSANFFKASSKTGET